MFRRLKLEARPINFPCQTDRTSVRFSPMKHDGVVAVRVPSELRAALEQERVRMSRKAGAEVKTSAVIRAILERALKSSRVKAA
jgi:hypothetical protein